MRGALQWVGIGLLLLAAGWFGQGCSPNPERDSKAYIDHIAPAVFKNWDPDFILQQADTRMRDYAAKNPELFRSHIQIMKDKVGPLQAYHGCFLGQKNIPNPDNAVVMGYIVDADFEKGKNEIIVETALNGGKWRLSFFVLDPDAKKKWLQKTPNPTPVSGQ